MEAMVSRRALLVSLAAAAIPAEARTGPVKIGVCGSAADFGKAEQFGFDYFEPAAAAIAGLSAQEFADFEKRVSHSRIRCEAFNSFIRSLQVVGPSVDREAVTAYVRSTLDRCRALGGEIVVWGSAGSRNVPEGFSREEAWKQIRSFLAAAGEIARERKIVLAIEPLRKQESNILNTCAESLRMVKEVDHPNVKTIVDYYHLREEKEDPSILEQGRGDIVHLHFANPNGRLWPKKADEDAEYGRFFEYVKKTRYAARISIEGRGSYETDAAASQEFFKNFLG